MVLGLIKMFKSDEGVNFSFENIEKIVFGGDVCIIKVSNSIIRFQ